MNLIDICIKNYQLILNHLDAIKNVDTKWLIDKSQNRSTTIQILYLILLLMLNYITIDSGFIIFRHCVFEAQCTKLINSTRLFTHRIFPQPFWYQGDIIMTIVVWMTISICLINLFNHCLNPRFCIYFIDKVDNNRTNFLFDYKQKMLPISIAKKILRYRSIGRKIVNNLSIATFILAYIFFVQPAWTNSYYQLNELVFYFFILPLILFDLVIVIIPIISFNVINIEYVQIRQWYVKYNQLACLNQHQINEHFRFKLILLKRITESIEQIGSSIDSYNQFWSPFFTIDFIAFSLGICYVSYSFFFKQSILLEKYFFAFFIVFDTLYMIYIIHKCANITRNNIIIEYIYHCNLLKVLWSPRMNLHLKLKVSFNVLKHINKIHFNLICFLLVQ